MSYASLVSPSNRDADETADAVRSALPRMRCRPSNRASAPPALARRLAIIMHAMLRHGTEFRPA